MKDDNWDLINGDAAHAIEVLNYSNQVNVIEALVILLMHHYKSEDGGCGTHPSVQTLQEFHRTATLFLLERPGQFRDCEVHVATSAGIVVHTPPPSDHVSDRLKEFFEHLSKTWATSSAQEIGAFALWMVNWVHPFKNGNGRTARAFCYACISLRLGFVLPGSPTIIDLIMENREEYQASLKVADMAFDATGAPDLGRMTTYLDDLLARQLSALQ